MQTGQRILTIPTVKAKRRGHSIHSMQGSRDTLANSAAAGNIKADVMALSARSGSTLNDQTS